MRIDWGEVRRGLERTWPFLLSHHVREEWDRCHTFAFAGRSVRVCARCSGVYPGILVGLLAVWAAAASFGSVLVMVVLPMPALVDWGASAFRERRGSNAVRTATGGLLGYAYGVGLGRLFVLGDLRVLAVGAVYAIATVALLATADA